jgi:pyrroline-5-carboxylate reductase
MSIEPSRLKYLVSSPGGVTIRGLYELEKNGVKGAIMSQYMKLTNAVKNCRIIMLS